MTDFSITERALDSLKVGTYTMASVEVVPQVQDLIADQLCYQLSARVLAEHIDSGEKSESVQFPASWWQHLKWDQAPQWFTRRWPVRYNTATLRVRLDRWATYPNADLPFNPRLGRMVIQDIASSGIDWVAE